MGITMATKKKTKKKFEPHYDEDGFMQLEEEDRARLELLDTQAALMRISSENAQHKLHSKTLEFNQLRGRLNNEMKTYVARQQGVLRERTKFTNELSKKYGVDLSAHDIVPETGRVMPQEKAAPS